MSDHVYYPKTKHVRSEPYRRLIAQMPCFGCGIEGHSQAAHPNTGKGAGIKTSDLDCFPLCADRPGVRGCHSLHDQGGLASKLDRRRLEVFYVESARTRARALGWSFGVSA